MTEQQGTHFWHMAIRTPAGDIHYGVGLCTPDSGATRLDLFKTIRDRLENNYLGAHDSTVLAFDIQPNKL